MHEMLAEKFVEQCRQIERDGDHLTVPIPHWESLAFALIEIARQRDVALAKLARLGKPMVAENIK